MPSVAPAHAAARVCPWLLDQLARPVDKSPLIEENGWLVSAAGRRYPVVDGVPVMLVDGVRNTIGIAAASFTAAREPHAHDRLLLETLNITDAERDAVAHLAATSPAVDPVVAYLIGATNGFAYLHLRGTLTDYPIPALRLAEGHGRSFLDIGCNWGRWSIAAARTGYRTVGIDPSLGAILAAQRTARRMGLPNCYVVGDARWLPFRDDAFDTAFSYSVLQHFSKEDVRATLGEVRRVLAPGGTTRIQMPNRFGVRAVYHQSRRRFRAPTGFEVRYWSVPELERTFASAIGPASTSIDCYFGLGLQASDVSRMQLTGRVATRVSEALRQLGGLLPVLRHGADSVYVSARRA